MRARVNDLIGGHTTPCPPQISARSHVHENMPCRNGGTTSLHATNHPLTASDTKYETDEPKLSRGAPGLEPIEKFAALLYESAIMPILPPLPPDVHDAVHSFQVEGLGRISSDGT